MSNEVYPGDIATMPGLTWNVVRRPTFKTIPQLSVSGKEVRASFMLYPLGEMDLTYSRLLQDSEFAQLIGFYKLRFGPSDSFLLSDPSDNFVTAQLLGTGTGSQNSFTFVRSKGSLFREPVSAIGGTPLIYLNGVLQTSVGLSFIKNNVIFANPPPFGVLVTATFNYYWRVRFKDDNLPFNNFAHKLWELKTVTFMRVAE